MVTELVDNNGNGYLADKTRFLRLPLQVQKEFVFFVISEFYDLVDDKKLIPEYKPNDVADVYEYICNRKILIQRFTRFRKSRISRVRSFLYSLEPVHKTDGGIIEKKVRKEETVGSIYSEDKDGKPHEAAIASRHSEMEDMVNDKMVSLCSMLCDKKLALPLPEKGDLGEIYECAGLQLYLRLDDTIERIKQLIEQVHTSVKAATHTEPSSTIRIAHQEAQEQIQKELKKLREEEEWNSKKNRKREHKLEIQDDIDRRVLKKVKKLYFYPLNAVQVKELLGTKTKNAAEKRISRYRIELLTEFLSHFSEQAEALFSERDFLEQERRRRR